MSGFAECVQCGDSVEVHGMTPDRDDREAERWLRDHKCRGSNVSEHEYETGEYVESDAYVPSTGAVRASYAKDYYMVEVSGKASPDARAAAFERWLDGVKADIWAEGYEAGVADEGIDERQYGLPGDPNRVNPYREEPLRIWWNKNLSGKITPMKLAAHAAHAALAAYGIKYTHPIVVLGAGKARIEAMPVTIHDAGYTELEPGTLTTGVEKSWTRPVTDAEVEAAAKSLAEYGLPDVPDTLWRTMAREALESARAV